MPKTRNNGFESGWKVALDSDGGEGLVAIQGSYKIIIKILNTPREVSKLLNLLGKEILFNPNTKEYKEIIPASKK